jgi:ABC-type polysaccharide/polyol phosphate transport system ATPase subunit
MHSDPSKVVLSAKDVSVVYEMTSSRATTLKEYALTRFKGKKQNVIANALMDANLEVRRGECVALIGHNGCGKSTFLKVIAGILKPAKGSVEVKGRIGPLIELGAGFDAELTGRENVFLSCGLLGLRRKEIERRLPEIEKFAELGPYFDMPVKTYSSGMYMRLGFSCTTAIDADLILIDEVLAVGDETFQKKCFEKLKETRRNGATILLVSHDLGSVARLADRVLVLNKGRVVFEGMSGEAIDFYHELLAREEAGKTSPEALEEEKRKRKLAINDARLRPELKEKGDARPTPRSRPAKAGRSRSKSTSRSRSTILRRSASPCTRRRDLGSSEATPIAT